VRERYWKESLEWKFSIMEWERKNGDWWFLRRVEG
jgi:hypothetical protein